MIARRMWRLQWVSLLLPNKFKVIVIIRKNYVTRYLRRKSIRLGTIRAGDDATLAICVTKKNTSTFIQEYSGNGSEFMPAKGANC